MPFMLKFQFLFYIPIEQKVPLWQALRIWGGGGPAVLKVEDDVWISPLQETDLNIDRLPQHFSDRVV